MSPRQARELGRNEALAKKAEAKEMNRVEGITRYEDQPRIRNYNDRVRETQLMTETGRSDTALRAGYNPNQSTQPTGTAAATGQQLQDRIAFANDLKGGTGEVTADVLKRAGALGLNQSDVGSYLRRVGKTPVAVNSATAPASSAATTSTAAPASAVAGPVAASTASGVPNSVSPVPKGAPTLGITSGALNTASNIGTRTAGAVGVPKNITDAVSRITGSATSEPAKPAVAAAKPAVAATPKPKPVSMINGQPAKEFLQKGYANELRLSRMGQGPEPFWRKDTMGENTEGQKRLTELEVERQNRMGEINSTIKQLGVDPEAGNRLSALVKKGYGKR
jgi:hypothetical protein